MNADAFDAALWDFCTEIYAGPGVAAACLALQDEAGADVPLLLAALWSAVEGPGLLSADELAALDHLVAPWRDQVVRPLRQVRRWMKASGLEGDPLRGRIKADELAAERRQLALIAGWLSRRRPTARGDADAALHGFLAWIGRPHADLEALVAAAYRRSR